MASLLPRLVSLCCFIARQGTEDEGDDGIEGLACDGEIDGVGNRGSCGTHGEAGRGKRRERRGT